MTTSLVLFLDKINGTLVFAMFVSLSDILYAIFSMFAYYAFFIQRPGKYLRLKNIGKQFSQYYQQTVTSTQCWHVTRYTLHRVRDMAFHILYRVLEVYKGGKLLIVNIFFWLYFQYYLDNWTMKNTY